MRSPLLDRPGAVPADPPDEGVAAHYGDPLREQHQLDTGVGAVDLSHRPVLRVEGPDRLTWLHSLTSQHLEHLQPGVEATALVLSPHGHVEHALYLVDDGDAVWVHVEPGTADVLLAYLDRMRFWSKVEVADVSADWAIVFDPCAAEHDQYLARVTDDGRDLFVPRTKVHRVVDDGYPAGVAAYEALRVAAGRPRLGRETDHRTIPHEVGWIGEAVHLDKGCYRGQETVARVQNLGRPPRRLVRLHLDGSTGRLPEHGTPVLHEGRPVGWVGTAAQHWELGPIALAVVKRSTPVDATLETDGIAAAQEPLVAP